MARTDLETMVYAIEANVSKLDRSWQKAIAATEAGSRSVEARTALMARKVEAEVGKIDLGKALNAPMARFSHTLVEEGTAGAGLLGSSFEALGAGGLVAAAGIGAAMAVMEDARGLMEFSEHVAQTAKELGMTTDQVQEFGYVAQQSNIPITKMNESLSGLNTTIGMVQKGLARAQSQKAFTEVLHISPDELRRWGDLETILPHILDAAEKLSSSERAAVAARLKMDPGVLNSLVEAKDKLGALVDEAHRYGLVVDADVIKKSEVAGDRMKAAADIIDRNLKVAFADLVGPISDATLGLSQWLAQLDKVALKQAMWTSLVLMMRGANAGPEILAGNNAIGMAPMLAEIARIKAVQAAAWGPAGHDIAGFNRTPAMQRWMTGGGDGGTGGRAGRTPAQHALAVTAEKIVDNALTDAIEAIRHKYGLVGPGAMDQAAALHSAIAAGISTKDAPEVGDFTARAQESVDTLAAHTHDQLYDAASSALHAAFSGNFLDFFLQRLENGAIDALASALSTMGSSGFAGGSGTGFGNFLTSALSFLGFAGGTDSAPGGFARINEMGTEGVAYLPKGTQVIPHRTLDAIARMPLGQMNGGNGVTNLTVNVHAEGAVVADQVRAMVYEGVGAVTQAGAAAMRRYPVEQARKARQRFR